MTPKHIKSTANVAYKSSHQVTQLETKLNMIQYNEEKNGGVYWSPLNSDVYWYPISS